MFEWKAQDAKGDAYGLGNSSGEQFVALGANTDTVDPAMAPTTTCDPQQPVRYLKLAELLRFGNKMQNCFQSHFRPASAVETHL